MSTLKQFTDRAEIYGLTLTDTDGDGIVDQLSVRTTNGGVDNITSAQFAAFTNTIYATTGFTFSINASGELIATVG